MLENSPHAVHDIVGAEALIQWFGKWPGFHDAEVLSITLNRNGASCVRIHTWEMTNDVDSEGYYVLRKHVVVSFFLEELNDIELNGFGHQNVIFGLDVVRAEQGLQLVLEPCYGVAGSLTAKAIRLEIEPGKPNLGNPFAPSSS